jgi:catechol 2,3-dioxygenase
MENLVCPNRSPGRGNGGAILSTAAMFQLIQIDHVALGVRDPIKSAEWYQSVLGLKRRHEEVWGDYPIMLCAGETCVALFPAKNTGPAEGSKTQSAITMRHFAFRANRENFQNAQETLKQRQIQFAFEDHQIAHSIYFSDPDGHQIEITTYDSCR